MKSLSNPETGRDAAAMTLTAIRRAVREHRDQIGDYRCWVDDEVLYHRVLPELAGKSPAIPDPRRFEDRCEAYFERRQDPKARFMLKARLVLVPNTPGSLRLSREEELPESSVFQRAGMLVRSCGCRSQ